MGTTHPWLRFTHDRKSATMDPYDLPTSITLTSCLKLWGTPKFEGEFFAEITEQEWQLPLEDLCSDGFSPSHSFDPEYSDLKIGKQAGEWFNGSFNVLFKEESNTGCRDYPLKGKVSA